MVNSCDIDAGRDHRPLTKWLLSGSCGPCRILAEKRKSCSLSLLEGVSELRWSHAHRPPKYMSEMARTSVADFERDFDEAVGCFADQLLRLQHALPGHELQWRHPSGLLEHAREMKRA